MGLAEGIAFAALVGVTGWLEFNGSDVDGLWILVVIWVLTIDWGQKREG